MRRLLATLLLSSCVVPQDNLGGGSLGKDQVLEATLPFVANGEQFIGTGRIKRSSYYNLTFELPEKTQYLLLSTCASDVKFVNPGREQSWRWVPTNAESSRWSRSQSCVLEALAIDQQGREHWGVLDISDNSTLEATVHCERATYKAPGTSFCQGRMGKFSLIEFATAVEPVSSSLLPDCPAPRPGHLFNVDEGRVWEVPYGRDLCVYGFFAPDGQRHRHTTRGWERVGIYR